MTKDEALKLALEALEGLFGTAEHFEGGGVAVWRLGGSAEPKQAITAIKEALAQPEQDNTYTYASSLATTIWQKHYMKESPKFALLDTTQGVLTQIDNMTCGLVREKPAQPEQEPVAWRYRGNLHEFDPSDWAEGSVTPLYTTPPQRTWVGLTDEERKEIWWSCEQQTPTTFVKAIEAKLREKNT
jgi:hypothetical protein